MKKLKLRKWVKVVLVGLVILLLTIIIKDMITKKTIVISEGKNYTCYGSIVQVCNGIDYDIE